MKIVTRIRQQDHAYKTCVGIIQTEEHSRIICRHNLYAEWFSKRPTKSCRRHTMMLARCLGFAHIPIQQNAAHNMLRQAAITVCPMRNGSVRCTQLHAYLYICQTCCAITCTAWFHSDHPVWRKLSTNETTTVVRHSGYHQLQSHNVHELFLFLFNWRGDSNNTRLQNNTK